jgi:hypothetical protein
VDISPQDRDGFLTMKATVKTYNEAASDNTADVAKKRKRGKP